MKSNLKIEEMDKLENFVQKKLDVIGDLDCNKKEYLSLAQKMPYDEVIKYYDFFYSMSKNTDSFIYLSNMREYFQKVKKVEITQEDFYKRIEDIDKIRLYNFQKGDHKIVNIPINSLIEIENSLKNNQPLYSYSLKDSELYYLYLAKKIPYDEVIKYYDFYYELSQNTDSYIYLENMSEYFHVTKEELIQRLLCIDKIRAYYKEKEKSCYNNINVERKAILENLVDVSNTPYYFLTDEEVLYVNLARKLPYRNMKSELDEFKNNPFKLLSHQYLKELEKNYNCSFKELFLRLNDVNELSRYYKEIKEESNDKLNTMVKIQKKMKKRMK